MRILILGANGLIGSHIFYVLSKDKSIEVKCIVRSKIRAGQFIAKLGDKYFVELKKFNDITNLTDSLEEINPDLVINCAGITKHNKNIYNIEETIFINSVFPNLLANICNKKNKRLLQISSDCVFSGNKGMYLEDSYRDAEDIYGMTKILGEINDNNNLTIRTSTIGHEFSSSNGLLNWFLKQKECSGFSNAIFSGPTTLELAKIIHEQIIPNNKLNGILNVSAIPIDKFSLLKIIKKLYGLSVKIKPNPKIKVNRSLDPCKFLTSTNYSIKSWELMIQEMLSEKELFSENV